jgi:polysaccharide pyruvyl transferase CsaB
MGSESMTVSRAGKILIAGYYGFGNVGDEAILSAILTDLRAQRQDLEFIVISADPQGTAAEFNVRSVDWKDVEGLLGAAKESDLILLGGGGLFQDYWGVPENTALTASHWGISYYSAMGMLAVLYQKPFMIYSVGVGPVVSEEGKQLTHWTFNTASACTVRDPESRDLLISLGVPGDKVTITPDPVLALELDVTSAAEILRAQGIDLQTPPLLGVCIRNWGEGEDGDQWKRELAAALDDFLESHEVQIVFIPFQIGSHTLENDHSVALDVLSMMAKRDKVCLFSEAFSPAVVGGLISHCHLIVGMRLHSLIFAANADVPAVALVYDPKVRSFMRSVGLSDYALELPSLTMGQLSEIFERAWTGREQTQQVLKKKTNKLKILAKKTTGMALSLLHRNSTLPFSSEAVQSLAVQQTRGLAKKEGEVQTLSSQLRTREYEVQVLTDRVHAQEHELNQILLSKTWKLALVFRKLRLSLAPVGSRRERFARALYRFARDSYQDLSKAATLIRQSVRRHGLLSATLRGFRILGIRLYHVNKKVLHRNQYQRELKQLEALIAQHTGFFDLFHVPMGWNTVLFQRFQHVSLQTAKLGGMALYGGHPVVDRDMTVFREAADNLYVFDATNRQIVQHIFEALKKKEQPRILRIESIDLVTTAEDVERFVRDGLTVVYEYIDEISPAITGSVPDSVFERHQAILKDERVIVVATSDQLLETVRRQRQTNFILSTNGVDLNHWRIPKGEAPADLKAALNGNLIIGYHGALAKWMDYGLLRVIADDGRYELVLIGHEHDSAFAESGLKQHPRVHFLGSKTYFELNQYAIHYDIAVLPFKKTALTQAVSPVKVFEYMAAGKPVVTTDLRECRKYKSCLVAGNQAEFMENLERATELRTDPDYLDLLAKDAQENSWEKKTVEILRLAGVKL